MNVLRGLGRMLLVMLLTTFAVSLLFLIWKTALLEYDKNLEPFIAVGSLGFAALAIFAVYCAWYFLGEMGHSCEKKP